jgi:hypothetical protein
MKKKRTIPPEAFSGNEIFHYFLTELELVVASGTIRWTAASTIAARSRLDKLAAMIDQLRTQPGNGK